ncbi:hypothetical protein Ancab_013998 [Ancistrocladus abbreviatus]
MATATAPQALQLLSPNPASSLHRSQPLLFKTRTLSLLSPPPRSLSLHLQSPKPYLPVLKVSASTSTPSLPSNSPSSCRSLLSDSTRTVSSLLAALFSVSRLFLKAIDSVSSKIRATMSANPTPEELAKIQTLKQTLVCSIGPLFFAALKDRPSGYLNTPLTVVASGMAKWLDIYSGVLMVRVLLSWFPNIPWDRQPLSAIRDLCDPYLNLFRNIIPPIFDTLDVSPLLAFAVLGTLGSILNNSRGTY